MIHSGYKVSRVALSRSSCQDEHEVKTEPLLSNFVCPPWVVRGGRW